VQPRPDLIFYFDFISPYAYLAFPEVLRLCEHHERNVIPVPVVLGAMLSHHGHLGPAEIPSKRLYTFKHVLRLAHERGRALTPPPGHPFNSLLALRMCLATSDIDARIRLVGRLFTATWGIDGPGITQPSVLEQLASGIGLDGGELCAQATSPEIKAALRDSTSEAISVGSFGVPSMLVDGELFWGLDSVPHIDRFLKGGDPIDPDTLAQWQDLPALAQRKRPS
jgi:2-hydroxychromene-2-carboxylate isomerase